MRPEDDEACLRLLCDLADLDRRMRAWNRIVLDVGIGQMSKVAMTRFLELVHRVFVPSLPISFGWLAVPWRLDLLGIERVN